MTFLTKQLGLGSLAYSFVFFLFFHSPIIAQEISKETISELQFRHIGPVGNRMISLAGVPGDPLVYYAGAASGGIWKTVDGGINWNPIFDDKPVHAIGALATAPSDPEVVWAGTGETFIRSNVSIGNGVWRSTDGGQSWEHKGLDKTGRIGRVVVHPKDPDVAYVAALGHAYSPQKERGIYRTKDGGETWSHILMVNDSTGASDLVMDPNNPRILFAGMWQLDLKTWTRESGGPGSAIYRSKDGGDSWERLEGKGLPKLPVGKIALAMTPADSKKIYALIETGDGVPWHGQETESGELWRSDDGGNNWKLVTHNRDLAGRSPYYSRLAVAPDDPDEAYFLAANFTLTKDGGKIIETPPFNSQPVWDHHDMWIDPSNPERMIVAGDGGLAISQNRGKSWMKVQLPVAQLYHVTTDNNIPYNVYSNRQDGPSVRGPSRSLLGGTFAMGGLPRSMWHGVGGGESGFATPDPEDPDIIWSSASGRGPLGGIVTRFNEKTRHYRQVEVWPEFTAGWPAEGVKYRFQWTFPLLISPHDRNTVYVTSQHVHRTRDEGHSWEVISPDLTLNDKSMQKISGGLTPDNIGVEYGNVIYALEESPIEEGLLWAGTNDGLVHITRDGGANWENVTKNIPGLPPLGTVRNIDASKWEAGKAYITVDLHQVGNFEPFVYKTENYGKSWKKITDGIGTDSPLDYVRCVREDPVRPGLLYLGTENKLYTSFDDGANWQPLMSNLPHTPMYWIDIQEEFNDMVIATYGRGIWILDDLSPLQQLTSEVASKSAYLFKPKSAYRFRSITPDMYILNDPSAGQDPPPGASLNYWLAEANDSINIRILNSDGDTIRTLKEKGQAGINRIWWDMRDEMSPEVLARTKPRYADWVSLGDERIRKLPFRMSVLVPPGTYQVEMEVNGEVQNQAIEILKDPNSEGDLANIAAQTMMMQGLKEEVQAVGKMVNQIEKIRRQLYDLRSLIKTMPGSKGEVETIGTLDEKLLGVEEKLFQMKLTGTGQDVIRWPAQLLDRLLYLASILEESADFPPSKSQQEVFEILQDRSLKYRMELDEILQNDLAEFKAGLQEKGLGTIIIDE